MGLVTLQVGNSAEFSRRIRAFADDVGNIAIRKTIAVTKDLFTRLVGYTPVRTGRARASWRIGVHTRDLSVEPPISPSAASGDPAVRAAATGVAMRQLNKLNKLKLRAGTRIYVTNSVPYIADLDRGTSTQAPNGMTALALTEVSALVKSLR